MIFTRRLVMPVFIKGMDNMLIRFRLRNLQFQYLESPIRENLRVLSEKICTLVNDVTPTFEK